jgi:Zn-finger nucleic acid-binding protein
MMFAGSKFCPHCGARSARAVAGETEMPCPKCKSLALIDVALGQTSVCECNGCHGLWVDADTFDTICTDRERQSVVLGSASELFKPGQRSIDLKVQYVRCPLCRELMQRVNFAKCSGIIVDVCKGHGSWFDRDELQHIVEFIRTGGLDLARSKEKAELEAARRRLEAARRDQSMPLDREPIRGAWTFGETDLFAIAGSLFDSLRRDD